MAVYIFKTDVKKLTFTHMPRACGEAGWDVWVSSRQPGAFRGLFEDMQGGEEKTSGYEEMGPGRGFTECRG